MDVKTNQMDEKTNQMDAKTNQMDETTSQIEVKVEERQIVRNIDRFMEQRVLTDEEAYQTKKRLDMKT
jgi:hypothetical protein